MTPDEKLELLLKAERSQAPTRARMERGFDRLQQALGAQVPPMDIGPVDPSLLAGPSVLGKLAALPWVAKVTAIVGIVASTGALVSSHTGTADAPAQPAAVLASAHPQPAVTTAGSSVSARPASTEAAVEAPGEANTRVPLPRTAPAHPLPTRANSITSRPTTQAAEVREPSTKAFDAASPNHTDATPAFDAELALIKRAKADFDAGRVERARAWLSEHARRYPAGVFAAEREGLLVLSACRANASAGEAGAFAFLRRYPQSPLAERVRRSCGLE